MRVRFRITVKLHFIRQVPLHRLKFLLYLVCLKFFSHCTIFLRALIALQSRVTRRTKITASKRICNKRWGGG